jgi:hypothetical protein
MHRSLLAPSKREEEASGRKNKRQRVDEEGEQKDGKAGVDVRLREELRGMLGGRKYAEESDLTLSFAPTSTWKESPAIVITFTKSTLPLLLSEASAQRRTRDSRWFPDLGQFA